MGKIIIDVVDRLANSDDFKCFVTMTDKFMSGWGCAEGKIAKRVYPCKDTRTAHELRDRILNRKNSGMSYVNIVLICQSILLLVTLRLTIWMQREHFVTNICFAGISFPAKYEFYV